MVTRVAQRPDRLGDIVDEHAAGSEDVGPQCELVDPVDGMQDRLGCELLDRRRDGVELDRLPRTRLLECLPKIAEKDVPRHTVDDEVMCYQPGPFMRGDMCDMACTDAMNASGCGHYTQVIWRNTQRVGCGVAVCPNGAEIWTCNYDPPGNYLGQNPY